MKNVDSKILEISILNLTRYPIFLQKILYLFSKQGFKIIYEVLVKELKKEFLKFDLNKN